MVKNKWFCKLLGFLSAVSMVFCSGLVGSSAGAMSCEKIIKYLSRNAMDFEGGVKVRFFDKRYAESENVLLLFKREMCKRFKTYAANTFVDGDLADVDSIDFLYLLLYVYEVALQENTVIANSAVCHLRFDFRDGFEQTNDGLMFLELRSVNDKFSVLEPLLGAL